jgi:DNA-directed RNA polymerase specialized sigma24 family protein
MTAEPSDADLLRRAQQGDADSFGLLFERHAPTVLRFCFRRTGNAALAEDLTSIVFLEAWRRREKTVFFRGRARPWLLGVALNVLRSQSRAERRYREALARLPAPAAPEPESDA